MSTTAARTPGVSGNYDDTQTSDRSYAPTVRRTTETKGAFKTTEFIAFVAVVAGILVAGLATKAGLHHRDVLTATQTWLYVAIVTAAYMISRGLAKSGSREPYTEDR